jgi:preprotein translocase subunit YajC
MFESPAFAQATNGGTAAGGMNVGSIINMVFPLLLVFVIFYVLMIRPQQKRMKQHQDMLGAVKPRDTAVTTGGLIGKVTKVDDNEVELEVAQGVRVRVVKSMLSDVRPHGAKAAND